MPMRSKMNFIRQGSLGITIFNQQKNKIRLLLCTSVYLACKLYLMYDKYFQGAMGDGHHQPEMAIFSESGRRENKS